MTICESLGEFETNTKKYGLFGVVNRKVKLKVTWVSCGTYSIDVQKFEELGVDSNKYTEPKTDFQMHMTPDHVEKVAELFDAAVTPDRMSSHKPFYEDYDPDRCMFDMGHDTLFQAFRQKERVILTNIYFEMGVPTSMDSLNMSFDEYKKFKAFLDERKDQIFYSGVKIGPAGVESVWVGPEKPDHVK